MSYFKLVCGIDWGREAVVNWQVTLFSFTDLRSGLSSYFSCQFAIFLYNFFIFLAKVFLIYNQGGNTRNCVDSENREISPLLG